VSVVAAEKSLTQPRDALVALRFIFLVNGIGAASCAPLIPILKTNLALSEADLGLTLLFAGIGTLIGMPVVTLLMVRLGCRVTVALGTAGLVLVLPAMMIAPSQAVLSGLLLWFGIALATQGMAGNTFAADIEKALARPLMSSFHAFYSLGGLVGALAVSGLLKLGFSAFSCILFVVVFVGVSALVTLPRLPPEPEGGRTAGRVFAMPRGRAWILGFFCFVSFLGEGSITDWGAVFLRFDRGFDASSAGLGYAGFAVAMSLSRLLGDLLIHRFGRVRVLAFGGSLAALGLTFIVAVPWGTVGLFGFLMVGFGAGNTVPILFSVASRLPTLSPVIAIPAISTFGCIGFLIGPATIGLIAHVTSLPLALFCVALLFATVAAGARVAR
jgi:fucose permease